MTEKAYITPKQTAALTCPMCRNIKTADVSKFVKIEKQIKINVKCPCGHAFSLILERRNRYRKETKLPGTFIRFVEGKPAGRGNLVVRDLSLTGIRIEAYENFKFSVGDVLEIEFCLDDVKKTLIKKKAVIRNIKNSYIGAAFVQTGMEDSTLGFYLMS